MGADDKGHRTTEWDRFTVGTETEVNGVMQFYDIHLAYYLRK